MGSSWKWVAASTTGTSHQRRGEGCQDYAHVLEVSQGEESTLLTACADGAGSASQAALAASLSCLTLLHQAAEFIRGKGTAKGLTPSLVRSWYEQTRRMLSLEACLQGRSLREYACTLLLAVVDDHGAAFAQIGDGAIVIREEEGYRPVFWPQSGEYASTTNFLSGHDFAEQLMICTLETPPQEIALLTDGLQHLALHYATQSVHVPFFTPMFEMLDRQAHSEDLQEPLKQFLDSQAVNNLTDDDKTLILATHRSHNHVNAPVL